MDLTGKDASIASTNCLFNICIDKELLCDCVKYILISMCLLGGK